MRTLHCLPGASAILLLVSVPLAPLLSQERGAMRNNQPLAEGKLVGAENHQASGTVHIVNAGEKRQLHFTPDFSLEKGPDVYITFTDGPKPVEGASLVVARLKRFSGEQSFDLPAGTDLGRYSHLVLWCKKYSVAMAVAPLTHHAEKMDGTMDKEGAMMDKGDTSKPE